MKLVHSINSVDTHAEGCPIRILTGGIPLLKGSTMLEKMLFMQKNYDWIRTLTMCEPRGHRQMVGAVLTEPISKEAHIGVFYIDSGWYAPMCGAGTIALSKALIEIGIVPIKEPVTTVIMDTPSGIVKAYANVKNGLVESVSFENVASFVYQKNNRTTIDEIGTVSYDICYGGNFFVFIKDSCIGFKVEPENSEILTHYGMKILKKINTEIEVRHPENHDIHFLNDIMITGETQIENGKKIYKNTVIFGGSQMDRSPCGTGTCARMALLYSCGELCVNEEFIHESIIGSRFTGKILKVDKREGYEYITCQVSGQTHITGFNNLVVDYDDRLKAGFLL